MSRFSSLLGQLDLENRILDINGRSKPDLLEPIDWQRINGILAQKKEQSLELLSYALKNG